MKKSYILAAAAMLTSGVATAAPVLTAGLYTSAGVVTQDNGNANCSAVGLTKNSFVTSVLQYPGESKTGLFLYTIPLPGVVQLCVGFPAVPAGGLNNFSATAKCEVVSSGGTVPPSPVNFSFTSTVVNGNSAVGSTTVTIPASDPVGGGCMATISTTLVRSGK